MVSRSATIRRMIGSALVLLTAAGSLPTSTAAALTAARPVAAGQVGAHSMLYLNHPFQRQAGDVQRGRRDRRNHDPA